MNHQPNALKADLFRRAEEFSEAHGITMSTLAHRVTKDCKFFKRLEGGGGFTIKTLEKFNRYFDEYAQ